jgi:hypothetical protein
LIDVPAAFFEPRDEWLWRKKPQPAIMIWVREIGTVCWCPFTPLRVPHPRSGFRKEEATHLDPHGRVVDVGLTAHGACVCGTLTRSVLRENQHARVFSCFGTARVDQVYSLDSTVRVFSSLDFIGGVGQP